MRRLLPGLLMLILCGLPGCYAGDETVTPDRHMPAMTGLFEVRSAFVGKPVSGDRKSPDSACPCFTEDDLNGLLRYAWSWGWWSDVPGCKAAPFDEVLEVWVADATKDGMRYNIGVQAGRMGDRYHLSWARFNHQTGRFDEHRSLEVSREAARPCVLLLGRFIRQLRVSHPDWDYCVRFP